MSDFKAKLHQIRFPLGLQAPLESLHRLYERLKIISVLTPLRAL